jgi:hypothetical protein
MSSALVLGCFSAAQICHAAEQTVNMNDQSGQANLVGKIISIRAENSSRFSPEDDGEIQKMIDSLNQYRESFDALPVSAEQFGANGVQLGSLSGSYRRMMRSLTSLQDQVTLFTANFKDLDDRYKLTDGLAEVENDGRTRGRVALDILHGNSQVQ